MMPPALLMNTCEREIKARIRVQIHKYPSIYLVLVTNMSLHLLVVLSIILRHSYIEILSNISLLKPRTERATKGHRILVL